MPLFMLLLLMMDDWDDGDDGMMEKVRGHITAHLIS